MTVLSLQELHTARLGSPERRLLIWRAFFALVLRRVDAETAHRLGTRALALTLAPRPLRRAVARACGVRGERRAAGRGDGADVPVAARPRRGVRQGRRAPRTRSPRSASASSRSGRSPRSPSRATRGRGCSGCRPTARWSTAWASTTAAPRPPRSGSPARRDPGLVVGVNIGKTKLADDAAADYRASAAALAPLADYLVINVSSPNTPGLRDLQAVEQLEPLVAAVREGMGGDAVPLLVKIAPDLADEDVDAVAAFALRVGLDGLIATNTTISRDGLATPARRGRGGGRRRPLRPARGRTFDAGAAAAARAPRRRLHHHLGRRGGERRRRVGAAGRTERRSSRPTPPSSTAVRCGRAGWCAGSPDGHARQVRTGRFGTPETLV